MTMLLNGQAVKVLFGSTSVTCSFGSICFQRARAARAAETAADHDDACRGLRERGRRKRQRRHGRRARAKNSRRLMRWLMPMPAAPYFCAASHAAIARNSSSEKPLAMRFITVAGSEPSRNPVIAVMISPASRPYSRETDVSRRCPGGVAAGAGRRTGRGVGSRQHRQAPCHDHRNADGDAQRFHQPIPPKLVGGGRRAAARCLRRR